MSQTQLEQFLTRDAKLAVLSTVDPSGQPTASPVWYEWRDGAAYVFTGRGTRKWRNLQANSRASLCVERRDSPYAGVVLEGVAEDVTDDEPLEEFVRRLAVRYYGVHRGEPFAQGYDEARDRVVVLRLQPSRVVSWDYRDDAE